MKTLFALFSFLLIFSTARSQAPQGIPYQAAAHSTSGTVLASTAISVRFSIRDSTATGAINYRETHSITTDANGMFSLNVGQGTPLTGTFAGINWGSNAKFLQVELDPAGGSSYINMGTQQMMSVPYSLYSTHASNGFPAGVTGDIMYYNGTNWVRLPIGTEGQLMTISGGIPSWICLLPPSAGNITGTATACPGSTTTLSNATMGGVWSSSLTSRATVNSSGVVTGVTAGTAIISYTVSNSCGSATAISVVTVYPLPFAGTIIGTDTVCAGSTTELNNATTGGTWSSSAVGVAIVGSTGIVSGVSSGTATISYTVTESCGSATATSIVTVNPLPYAGTITGTDTVCAGITTALSNATTGGAWSSSDIGVAAVGGTGILIGVAAGTATISYTVTNGCGNAEATIVVTINALPDAGTINGTATVCPGSTTALSNTNTGGAWSSSFTGVATVGSTGVVTGVAAGTATISYTVTNGCGSAEATRVVTINALPNAGTISGTATLTAGSTTTLSNATTGGAWSSSATGIATVGSMGAVTGVAPGTATISYTVTTTCGIAVATRVATVNPALLTVGATYFGGKIAYILQPGDPGYVAGQTHGIIAANSDQSTGIEWGCMGINLSGTSTNLSTGSANTNIITTACGAGIAASLCADLVEGGYNDWYLPSRDELDKLFINKTVIGGFSTNSYWSSSQFSNASSYRVNFFSGTLLTSGKTTSLYVRAVRAFSYPEAIVGTNTVCLGSNTTLSSATTGGTWSSSNGAVATVNSSGIVSGVSVGTVVISYAATGIFGAGTTSRIVTVNLSTLPNAGTITGTATVTALNTITLSNATTGGTWSSSATSIATVGSTGIVTGVAAGTATISYTVTNACGSAIATYVVTVNPLTIGMSYGGGKVAYILVPGNTGYVAGETHGLIAAPSDQSSGMQWGCYGTTVGGTFHGLGFGAANTAIVSAACGGDAPARLCENLVLNGYSDWYLPSKDELINLRVNKSLIGGFTTGYYWSSSEYDIDASWYVHFDITIGGPAFTNYKNRYYYVRAVRSF